jgi:hypothetical protein
MARYSIPQANNFVARCLRNVMDPVPTARERKLIWEYFENRCAYCGWEMSPTGRIGHLDHIIPTGSGGSNHRSNFVLSCPECNGDGKRETDWVTFLRNTAGADFELRRSRIQAWLDTGSDEERKLSPTDLAVLDRVSHEVKSAILRAAEELRALR